MTDRLTDDELEALVARFAPGRHPKIAAALAELKARRTSDRNVVSETIVRSAPITAHSFALFACACGHSEELPTGTTCPPCCPKCGSRDVWEVLPTSAGLDWGAVNETERRILFGSEEPA